MECIIRTLSNGRAWFRGQLADAEEEEKRGEPSLAVAMFAEELSALRSLRGHA